MYILIAYYFTLIIATISYCHNELCKSSTVNAINNIIITNQQLLSISTPFEKSHMHESAFGESTEIIKTRNWIGIIIPTNKLFLKKDPILE